MIYDKENCFIFNKDVSTTPDVIANGAGGNAYSESFLSAKFAKPITVATTIALQTSDDEAMGSPATLCTLTLPIGAQHGSIRIPFGGKKFYGIAVTGATSGTCTIGLTLDGELE